MIPEVEDVRSSDDGSKRRPGPTIVTVSPDFKPNLGGEAELAYQLARAFQEQGRLLRVVAPSHETAPEDQALGSALSRAMPLDRFLALDSVRAALRWPVAMASLIQSLRRAVPERRDVTWLLTSYMAWIVIAFWRLGVDYSLFLHGEDVTWACSRGRMKRWLFPRACRRSRWIFFNSAFSRDNLIRRFPEFTPKTRVAGCGVVPGTEWTAGRREEARALLGWGSGPVLLTVATLRLRKGIDTVIRALYVPNAVVYHEPSQTFEGGSYTTNYASRKAANWLLFVRKHASPGQALALFLLGLPAALVRSSLRIVIGMIPSRIQLLASGSEGSSSRVTASRANLTSTSQGDRGWSRVGLPRPVLRRLEP